MPQGPFTRRVNAPAGQETNPVYAIDASHINELQQGLEVLPTGAEWTAAQAAIARVESRVFDVRKYGATGNGSTNDTTAIQAAIDAAEAAGGGVVFFPKGTYLVTALTVDVDGISLRGVSRRASLLRTSTGNLVTLGLGVEYFVCENMALHSLSGGGHVFHTPTPPSGENGIAHCLWTNLTIQQDNTGKSILDFDDGGTGRLVYIDNLWANVDTYHSLSATVPTFNLRGLAINRNRWTNMRPTYSGNYTWRIEATGGSVYALDNTIDGITGEVLNGGVAEILGGQGIRFADIGIYDLGTTTRDLFELGTSTVASGTSTVYVAFDNVRRVGGTLGSSLYDVDVNTGAVASPAVRFVLCGGSTAFAVNARTKRVMVEGGNVTLTGGTFATIIRANSGGNTFFDPVTFGGFVGFYGTTPIAKPTVTGSKGANAALTSLIDQLEALGLITDSTS